MFQYGMVSHWEGKQGPLGPVLKPTGMLTFSWCLQLELSRRCPRSHEHVHLVGGRAAAAQEYPKELCESICRGLAAQKKEDLSRRFTTLAMNNSRRSSLSQLCCEASGNCVDGDGCISALADEEVLVQVGGGGTRSDREVDGHSSARSDEAKAAPAGEATTVPRKTYDAERERSLLALLLIR